jgi:hypothetical protein
MLCAKSLRDVGKVGQSFKLSRGQGSIQLKCEQELRRSTQQQPAKDESSVAVATSLIHFSIGSATSSSSTDAAATARTVRHNFTQSAACVSPDWDFRSVVNESAQSFVVSVHIALAQ